MFIHENNLNGPPCCDIYIGMIASIVKYTKSILMQLVCGQSINGKKNKNYFSLQKESQRNNSGSIHIYLKSHSYQNWRPCVEAFILEKH